MNAVTPPPSVGAGEGASVGGAEGEGPHLALDGFAGGLASLLSLARTHAIDLARLSIADFIRQVAAALEPTAPAIPLARKADWLVMAAWLVLLRSRLLLPAAPEDPAGAADADRRADRGRDLSAAQALAAWLAQRPQLGIDVFARGQPEPLGTEIGARHEVDIIEFLWACLAQFAGDPDNVDATAVYRPPCYGLCSVLDARARLLRLLPEGSAETPLGWFLPELPAAAENEALARITLRRRSAVASTLLAGLELAREGWLTVQQKAPFATITLAARTEAKQDPTQAVA